MDGEPLHLGMLADSVQEVIDIDPSQIDPPPKLGSHAQHRIHPRHGQAR